MSIDRIHKQINYFKACYQADNRTLSISNIFQAKIENRYFFDDQEFLLTRELNEMPIRDDYAEEVIKNLEIYKREKTLYYCALFTIGKNHDSQIGSGKICSPLLMYPAEITYDDESHYLRIDHEKGIINIDFLASLRKNESDDLYDLISNCINSSFEDFSPIGELVRTLESKLEDIDGSDLFLFPKLYGEGKIKRLLQPKNLEKSKEFRIVPAACLCVVRRSANTRGIVSELSQLSKEANLSTSLEYLLDERASEKTNQLRKGNVPSLLSDAQIDAIKTVCKHKGSLIIGPPGTGKSYTIASLAVSFLSQGKNVLIACKTDEAVDVVYRKIEKDLRLQKTAMRAGRSDYKKQLKSMLSDLLSNSRKRPKDASGDLSQLEKKLKDKRKQLDNWASYFTKQVAKDLRWGSFLSTYGENRSAFDRLKFRYIRWRSRNRNKHWQVASQYLDSSIRYLDYLRDHIVMGFDQQVHKALYSSRVMFRDFHKSLSARNSQRQDLLFKNIDLGKLLDTFPIWLSNMSDIHDVLPMSPDLFDLVIIDEASQCDIASALPVMQRGKRFAIVGDPKQLRHASFISRSLQSNLAKKFELEDDYVDYRTTSILDLVMNRITSQEQVVFLNEHFRSRPKIISFSNKQFYNEELKIMTSLESMNTSNSIELVRTDGKRNKKGCNEKEADLVLRRIKEIIEEERNLNEELAQTIGVLSPFRDQVEYLGTLISKEIDIADIQKHEIACGTAYSFQGEERDVMLLSFGVDEESHHSAFNHLNKEDVFNVSVTRARSLQVIYTSFSSTFDPGKNLKAYLSHVQKEVINSNPDSRKDLFVEEVLSRLKSDNLEYWLKYSVGGLNIDILLRNKEEELFGINLIGYPGEYEDALRIEDYKVLKRAGLPVFPLPYSYWLFDQDSCYEELIRFAKL